MSIMVIYLMDKDDEEIEVSAEYFGKDSKSDRKSTRLNSSHT